MVCLLCTPETKKRGQVCSFELLLLPVLHLRSANEILFIIAANETLTERRRVKDSSTNHDSCTSNISDNITLPRTTFSIDS